MEEIRKLLDSAKVKPAITRYVNRLKSERNYPDVIFKLRNFACVSVSWVYEWRF